MARRKPIGRRRRRLRRAALLLGLAAGVTLAGGLVAWWLSRPTTRQPGEDLPEITAKLARGLPEDAPMPRFADVTAEAGLGGFRSFVGDRTSQLPEDMGSGAAWGDYDGDGDEDLFLVAAGGALSLPLAERTPSMLYENLGNGTFRPFEGFPDTRVVGMAAAWGDYDGDGRLDLALTGYRALRLYRNAGDRFVRDEGFVELDGYWAGAAWGDFDRDGDLDLYVCGYVRYREEAEGSRRVSEQYGRAVPYTLNPASYEPERNLLFQNDGRGGFVEVAELYGVSNPGGRSLTALWHDFDADGRLDLYVANDISDNALFLNRGETFEDAGLSAWVADYRGAMGLAAGDWNRDGDDDLFVTHWIAQENALYDSQLRDLPAAEGSGSERPAFLAFRDLAAPLGLGQIALHLVGWGTEFADVDGDGWLDLVVANGSTFETEETPRRLKPQPFQLLWNRRGEFFHDLAPLSELLAAPRVARGLALADYDRDGDLDVLLVRLDGGAELLRNDMQQGRWIGLRLRDRLRGDVRGRGEGAVAIVRVGGLELRRSATGASYLSQSSRTLHFGLGDAARVDEVEVLWPTGGADRYGPLESGAVWEVTEGDPEPRRLADAGPVDERQRLVEFWATQRAAMDAMKREGNHAKAVELFRRALALDPAHQDSRYYLANLLAAEGRVEEALGELDEVVRRDPMSHRALKQRGVLRALHARSPADLEEAERWLERAHEVNSEETGSLLVLGEIALLKGEDAVAEQRFAWACHTNPKAVAGFFLRGYLAWKRGDEGEARALLAAARVARGPEWKPEGAVAEGDVAARMHREETPLAPYWRGWDGEEDPAAAFAPVAAALTGRTP